MRSDTIPGLPTSRIPSTANHNNNPSSSTAEIHLSGPPSNGTMRAFPPSPDKASPSTLPITALPSPSKPASPAKTSVNGNAVASGPPPPLSPSLFAPPTSAGDLAAKLKLAEMKLAELTAQAKLAEGHLDLVKRAAKRKEGEQERELNALRRELEGAKRAAVELQMKAGVTQRLVERIAREDDKIGLSLSLIENLAHRARVNPGPQGGPFSQPRLPL
ncbi:hypothetical protein BDY24DRAFT_164372 [Mrakia frigida]|uniref:uncharacterized protein n=1 Tax=Mrakia frigida TaxID=29902 RepID=UPI003FCBEF60